jgi:hypothetical protein
VKYEIPFLIHGLSFSLRDFLSILFIREKEGKNKEGQGRECKNRVLASGPKKGYPASLGFVKETPSPLYLSEKTWVTL